MQRAKSILGAIVLLATLFMLSKAQAQSLGPNGHYYKLVLEPGLLWEEARIKAAESTLNGVHGYLATIGSVEEDQFIESLRQSANSNAIVWLGGSQATNAASSKSGWVWVNGEGLIPGENGGDVYAHWMLGEPDDVAGPNTEQFLAIGQFNLPGWSSEADDRHVNGYVIEYPSAGVANKVSVVTIDPVAVEDDGTDVPTNIATFEFRRSGDMSLDLPVFYSVGGTAQNGNDYEEIQKSIIIPAGEATAQLNIVPLSDLLTVVEPMETVGIRIEPSLILTPEASYTISADRREAAAVIYELVPPKAGGLQIAVPPSNTTYQPTEPVVALAALSFSNVVETVDFWYTTFSPFASNKIASVSAYSRTNELAFYRLNWTNPISGKGAITALAYPTTSSNRLASLPFSITVLGDTNPPVVSIRSVTPPDSTNTFVAADYAPGYFEVSRAGSTFGNLQVFYSIGGSATAGADYDPLANYVVIGNGKTTAKIVVNAIDDSLPELTEFVTLSLITPTNGVPAYTVDPANSQASVAIYDNDPIPTDTVVSLEVSSPDAKEPLPWAVASGEFIVRRTGETSFDLPVRVSLGGTATYGADYGTYLLNSNNIVVIPAGSSYSQFLIVPVADTIIEPDETVVAELASSPAGSVPYGIDANHRRGVVTIHDTTAQMPTNSIVGIGASVNETWEPGGTNTTPGQFTIFRGAPTNQAIRVSFVIAGTASNGVDYATLPDHVDFAAGQTATFLTVNPLADNLAEGNETVYLQLKSSDAYTIDPDNHYAVVQIHNTTTTVTNPPPTNTNIVVSLELVSPDASEPNTNGITTSVALIAHRAGPTNTALAVNIAYSGTATFGVDYSATNRVIIPPGGTLAYFSVTPLGDNLVEGDETVNVQIATSTNAPGYLIDTNHYTATVIIHDTTPPSTNVVVSLTAISTDASEPNIQGITTSASLLLHRTGPTNTQLTVYLGYSGTATYGQDYAASNSVVIPVGASEQLFSVIPLRDNLVEGDETVIAELLLIPGSALPHYGADPDHHRVTVTIHDANTNENRAPIATIVKPGAGAVFTVGDSIEIIAEGSDSDGNVKKMELLADDISLGSINTNRIVLHWTNAPVGQHVLVAKATDNKDKVGVSTNVTILVRAKNAGAFVFRNLPDAYTPGVAFRVELRAEPPTSAHAYAVEDRPPQGWQVTAISNDGYFDATNGKVKFGPFADALARTLTYTVTPPSSASGHREFAGNGSIDGVSYAIGGDETIEQGSQYHPADGNSDFRIVLDEVTAYTAAWKTGTNSNNTNAIPLSFVTRAGYLWKHGEAYRFNASAGDPPLCWVPLTAPDGLVAAASGGVAVRAGAELLQPGLAAEMQIGVVPATGTAAYAVEEQIPNGWTVTNINEGGVFDANTSTIRWGVFFDGASRTLRYTVTPPANIAEIGRLRGTVSFDGLKAEITGHDRVVSFEDAKRPTLQNCERVAGGIRVTLGGEAGQVGILQRSSDLENWQDVTTIFLPDGTAEYTDQAEIGGQYFYRLQIR